MPESGASGRWALVHCPGSVASLALSAGNAQTINEQGVTIVPLDVRTLDNGEVFVRAKDPAYATPGPDEAQKFRLE